MGDDLMRRTASGVLRELEMRVARLEDFGPEKCAEVLEGLLEDISSSSPQNLTWTKPNKIGEGKVELLVDSVALQRGLDRYTQKILGGRTAQDIYRCIVRYFSEIDRELEKITSWADVTKSFDDGDSVQSAYFQFTSFKLHEAEMTRHGLYITFNYRGFEDWGAWGG